VPPAELPPTQQEDVQALASSDDTHKALGLILSRLQGLQESQLSLTDQVNVMTRKQDVSMALAGYHFKTPVARVSAAYVYEIQTAMVNVHATHQREEMLKSVDLAMGKLNEFFKVIKRADSTPSGWYIASNLVVQNTQASTFDERWKEAQRLNENFLSSKPIKSPRISPPGNGNQAATQSFDPSVGPATLNSGYVPQSQVQNQSFAQQNQRVGPIQQTSQSTMAGPTLPFRPVRDQSTVTCWACGSRGHYASACKLRTDFFSAPSNQNSISPSNPGNQNSNQ
jgi:hypothetical protein